MKNIFSPRNLRFVVITFSVYGMICLGKGVFYFIYPKQEVVVPTNMIYEYQNSMAQSNTNLEMGISNANQLFDKRKHEDPYKVTKWKLKSDSASVILDSLIEEIRLLEKSYPNNFSGERIKSDYNSATIDCIKFIDDPIIKKEFQSVKSLFQFGDSIPDLINMFLESKINMNSFFQILTNKTLIVKHQLNNYFLRQVYAIVCDFGPSISARALSNRNIVHDGEMYNADIFLMNSIINAQPKIYIGSLNSEVTNYKKEYGGFIPVKKNPVLDGNKIETLNGYGRFYTVSYHVGIHKYSGAIEVTVEDGNPEYFPFEAEYEVIPKTQK